MDIQVDSTTNETILFSPNFDYLYLLQSFVPSSHHQKEEKLSLSLIYLNLSALPFGGLRRGSRESRDSRGTTEKGETRDPVGHGGIIRWFGIGPRLEWRARIIGTRQRPTLSRSRRWRHRSASANSARPTVSTDRLLREAISGAGAEGSIGSDGSSSQPKTHDSGRQPSSASCQIASFPDLGFPTRQYSPARVSIGSCPGVGRVLELGWSRLRF